MAESTKARKKKENNGKFINVCQKHNVDSEVNKIQEHLLSWYDTHQRTLPWRDIAKSEPDPNIRGYAVWVSEIMLQQTQVATVISYFNKWIKKWPTVEKLASADLEDVNKVWAGLGYYSRARRLHEGAMIVINKLNGKIPQSVDELMSLIPGIGQYSASAIASVAFQKPVGVVDGNVIRVLSRMKVISAPVTQTGVREHLWNIANRIVCTKRPGDFNQALMELGAVVCTPQNPKCPDCPVNSCCGAYAMVKKGVKSGSLDSFLKKKSQFEYNGISNGNKVIDIENANECAFCIDPSVWKENPQVTAFPSKVEKKAARLETVVVVVIGKGQRYFMTKRPEKGLLAGLWEFPNVLVNSSASSEKNLVDEMLAKFGISHSLASKRKYVDEVIHIFSHIKSTYVVEHLKLGESFELKNISKDCVWYTSEEIKTSAVSTAMKKVFEAVKKADGTVSNQSKRKRKASDSKQASIKSFFT